MKFKAVVAPYPGLRHGYCMAFEEIAMLKDALEFEVEADTRAEAIEKAKVGTTKFSIVDVERII